MNTTTINLAIKALQRELNDIKGKERSMQANMYLYNHRTDVDEFYVRAERYRQQAEEHKKAINELKQMKKGGVLV